MFWFSFLSSMSPSLHVSLFLFSIFLLFNSPFRISSTLVLLFYFLLLFSSFFLCYSIFFFYFNNHDSVYVHIVHIATKKNFFLHQAYDPSTSDQVSVFLHTHTICVVCIPWSFATQEYTTLGWKCTFMYNDEKSIHKTKTHQQQ